MSWWLLVVLSVPTIGAVTYGLSRQTKDTHGDMAFLVLWSLFWPLALIDTLIITIRETFE